MTEAQLLKKLSKDLEKSSLDKKFDDSWILEMHISNVVKIQPLEVLLRKLENKVFNENIVIQLILVYACCVFSIAAENRFISHQEISEKQENEQMNNSQKLLQNYSKELVMQKHE